jgi:DNA-binding MarR family transcriptional regulator
LLRALEQHGDQTMTTLALSLNITQRRITSLVAALVADGLVSRAPNPVDGRSTVISMTEPGRKNLETYWPQFQAAVSAAFGDIPAEQQEQLLAITPVLTHAMGAPLAALAGRIPLGRFGDPRDIAEAVAFLASSRGQWITGAEFDVTGGQ